LKTRGLLPATLAAAMGLVALGALSGISARGAAQANGQTGANAEGIKILVDHNTGDAATPAFRFAHVPSPVGNDAAAKATITVVAGVVDPNSGGVYKLTDGRLPQEEDEPESNLFFDAGTWGGRFRMDLGSVIDIAQVNSYSWHPSTRGPQVYVMYASDGTDPNFDPAPKTKVDPTTVGWHRVASVDTRVKPGAGGQDGGQYGVSISHVSGSIGKYRYLLFDCFETESDDDWGNTFYSEIDVVAKQ
jgi:hypothetical protein